MYWADQHGLWGLVSTLVLVVSAAVGFSVLFWGKGRVRNLNFFVRRLRDGSNYPLKVYIVNSKLRPDPNARGESPSGEYEVKFPDPASQTLSEVEYLLRHGESVSTWVPIDPSHTDAEVDQAIASHGVGKLRCMCTWLLEKPKVHKLTRRI
jgi:hypothetical protein